MKIKNTVFLVQTDTTVGLLSKNAKRLGFIKKRDDKKLFIKSVATFKELKKEVHIPDNFKKTVRRKKRTTFVKTVKTYLAKDMKLWQLKNF